MRVFPATFTLILLCSTLLKAKDSYSSKHHHFLENKGQVKDQYHNQSTDIDFKLSSGGVNVFIGNGELHYQFHKPAATGMEKSITKDSEPIPMYRMDVTLLNANKNARLIAEDKLPYYEQHYRTTTPVTAHSFSKITYKDIYPSIDWVLYIKDNQLEYDFVIHKGGNPADIKLQYNGATSLMINKDGSLSATTPMGSITEEAPYSYQEDGKHVASSFALSNNILSFKTAAHKGTLVIDPKLVWSTYYGGTSAENSFAVDVDESGDVYISGNTQSVSNIATTGSHQFIYGGGMFDAFLAKFDSSGQQLWATYYGGSQTENWFTIACDKFDHVYLSGYTISMTGISTPGSYQPNKDLNSDAFLVKFDGDGNRLWATYFGGDSLDYSYATACDDSGNVYIGGATGSANGLSTPGVHQPVYANIGTIGGSDGFLAKFDSLGNLSWATYYGGLGGDNLFGIATDAQCNVYIAGLTGSADAISTVGAEQPGLAGEDDAFLAKFNNTGQLVWGSYYGGLAGDVGQGICVSGPNVYLSGMTYSAENIATPGSFQPTIGGSLDIFLAKFDVLGNREWGTYYGGVGGDMYQTSMGNKVACDNNGDIYMIFATSSTSLMTTQDGPQVNYGGGVTDLLLSKFTGAGTREWATYFGTCAYEGEAACAVDNWGNIYAAGTTTSEYIATRGSHQEVSAGGNEVYLAKFNNDIFKLNGDTAICAGDPMTLYASFVPGAESYTWTLPNGWSGASTIDTINVVVGTTSGTVSVVANKSCSNEPPQELYITVNPLPVPVLNQSGGVLSVAGTYVSYQWCNTAGPIAGATAPTFAIPDPNEYYYVIVTDTNACVGQSGTINLSVGNLATGNNMLLYPNPNDGSFTLSLKGLNSNEEVSIEIMDITGRSIKNFTEQVKAGIINKTIDLGQGLATGQYLLRITSGTLNFTTIFTKN